MKHLLTVAVLVLLHVTPMAAQEPIAETLLGRYFSVAANENGRQHCRDCVPHRSNARAACCCCR